MGSFLLRDSVAGLDPSAKESQPSAQLRLLQALAPPSSCIQSSFSSLKNGSPLSSSGYCTIPHGFQGTLPIAFL